MKRGRWLLILLIYAFLIGTGWLAGDWLADLAIVDVRPSNEPEVHRMVMTTTAIFIVASAVPFVPGAEIGLALILALGTRVVFLVYGAMVAALMLAFLIGRFVPSRVTAAAFDLLGLHKARDLVLRMAPLRAEERLALLVERAPTRIIPFLLRHRYIALAVIINLPGNTLVGGGGGIALVAGMSGLYAALPYAATIAVAVAPLPLLVLWTGYLPGG